MRGCDCCQTLCVCLQVVDTEYRELHPDEVEEVHVLNDTAVLERLVKEYQKLQRSLEDLIDDFTSKKRRSKKIKPKLVCRPQKDDMILGRPFICCSKSS